MIFSLGPIELSISIGDLHVSRTIEDLNKRGWVVDSIFHLGDVKLHIDIWFRKFYVNQNHKNSYHICKYKASNSKGAWFKSCFTGINHCGIIDLPT